YLPGQLQGDMNNDGTLDILDLVSIVNIILSNSFDSLGDMNADGQLNILDLVTLVNIILA
ncbi:MAG: dockerin type I domain-containing protein, partial [Candidatus Marinimicrobia bacterium]|nr:dockerin type I domain-containing protein [Candidatus Neomarinimicrobiota bacterium]